MIKNYILHNDYGEIKQFIRCDESEIYLYGYLYLEIEQDYFEFDVNYTYKIENNNIVKTKRTDEAYLKVINKKNMSLAISKIEIEYNGIIYQGDETSQDRMSRTINGLPDEVSAVPWVAKDNYIQYLTKLDLQQILYLAVQEQSRLLSEGRPLLKE